jgi:hypothetical protein
MTLLEVLLAMTLTAMLLTGVYLFYSNTLRARAAADDLTDDTQLARVILTRIADDIRYAAAYMPGYGVGLQGGRHEVSLYRAVVPEPDVYNVYDPELEELPPAKADVRRVEYRLIWDDENEDEEGNPICHGLFRSVQKTLNQVYVIENDDGTGMSSQSRLQAADNEAKDVDGDGQPDEGAEGELMAPEIKFLEFTYFDGAEWTDEWLGGFENENSLPQAVMITIGRVPVPPEEEEALGLSIEERLDPTEREETLLEHPDRYSVIVRLVHADRFLTSRVVNARSKLSEF